MRAGPALDICGTPPSFCWASGGDSCERQGEEVEFYSDVFCSKSGMCFNNRKREYSKFVIFSS